MRFLPNGHTITPRPSGLRRIPLPAQAPTKGAWPPDRAPIFVVAMAVALYDGPAKGCRPFVMFIAPIRSSFSRIIFVCERPVISSVRCKTGNGAATRGD